jgi:NitT/TauT family transport system substrate-binding protein
MGRWGMLRSLGIAVAFTLVVAACGGGAAPAGSSAPTSAVATTAPTPVPLKVKLAYGNISGDFMPVWVAQDAGIYRKNGLDVELISIDGGSRTMATILSGDVQAGVVGGAESLSATAEGASIKTFAVLVPVFPYLFMGAPEIKTVADLRGKKVGISSVGGSADIATRKVLRDSGLDPDKDVALISLGSHAQRTAALFAGAIQAAVDDPPNTTELTEKGFHSLYDLAGKRVASAQTTVVAKSEYVAANREVIQRLTDSFVEAIAWTKKNRPEAEKIMRKYFGNSTKPGFTEALEFFINEVHLPLPFPRPELWADAQAELAKKNPKVKDIDVKTIVDASFVQSAADRGIDKR